METLDKTSLSDNISDNRLQFATVH